MCDNGHVGSYDEFHDYLAEIEPIRLREPLAETLGAVKREGAPIEYTFVEVVKLAGHACPTTASAYECCRSALNRLYPAQTPVRGDIEVTVYGAPDDGVYGVIGQVFGFLTGAAPSTGFKGLGTSFRRKDLLTYQEESPDPSAMCFRFRRKDNGKAVLCRIYHDAMPALDREKTKRLGELMPKVLWEAAKKDEISEFRRLWMDSVKLVCESASTNNKWLKIEEVT